VFLWVIQLFSSLPTAKLIFLFAKTLFPQLQNVHPKPWYVYPKPWDVRSKSWYVYPKAWDVTFAVQKYNFFSYLAKVSVQCVEIFLIS
jgi:hypothetical protein